MENRQKGELRGQYALAGVLFGPSVATLVLVPGAGPSGAGLANASPRALCSQQPLSVSSSRTVTAELKDNQGLSLVRDLRQEQVRLLGSTAVCFSGLLPSLPSHTAPNHQTKTS